MSASDYPVTFPYGATTPPYGPTGTAGPYHRGDDRYMPIGTPVLVNLTQIGLSGESGEATGPHLHIGRFVDGKDTNPHGQGFFIKSPVVVFGTGYDSINGNYVQLTDGDGVLWVYLHLSHINVTKGQVIDDMDEVASLKKTIADYEKRINDLQNEVNGLNQTAHDYEARINTLQDELNHANAALNNPVVLAPGMYKVA